MHSNEKRIGRTMIAGLSLSLLMGCGKPSQEECDGIRGEAFTIVNEAHTCNGDADCVASEWPGCAKPVSQKNQERLSPLQKKFTDGKCEEPTQKCRPTPEIYCKQGLCVTREKPDNVNP